MYTQHLTEAMMGGEELLAALFLLPHNPAFSNIHDSSFHEKGANSTK